MYADYDFYLNSYHGNAISVEDFQRLSERASDYIRAMTQGVSDKVDGWRLEAVKKASCAIADILLDEEIMNTSAFSGEQQVSSESVGSWSRSYKTAAISTADTQYINSQKTEALMLYLGGLSAFAGIFKVRSYPCLHRRG